MPYVPFKSILIILAIAARTCYLTRCSRRWHSYSLLDGRARPSQEATPLRYAENRTLLVQNDCNSSVALYMGTRLFLTRNGFEGTLYPLYFSGDGVSVGRVTSAAFVSEGLVLVIDGKVYVYALEDHTWTPAQGVGSLMTEVSSLQCCFSTEPPCTAVSSTVLVYNRGHPVQDTNVFLSSDGGFQFERFALPPTLQGVVEMVFNMPTLSTILVMITDDKNRSSFSYVTSDLNLQSDVFSLRGPLDRVHVVQPPGMTGHLVIWSLRSLFYSPNHGQFILPLKPDVEGDSGVFPGPDVFLQQVATSENSEIAVLTSKGMLYYGRLSMDAVIVQMKNLTDFSEQAVLMFSSFGDLLVTRPIEDPSTGGVDFDHCLIVVQQQLSHLVPLLGTCPVEVLYGSFDRGVYYIDMGDHLYLSAVFIPAPLRQVFPLVTVTDPHLLAFQAVSKEDGITSDGNTKYTLSIKLRQQRGAEMAHDSFHHSSLDGGISTLTVDVVGKEISCKDMPPLHAYINVRCPPGKHIKVLRNVTACTKGTFTQGLLQNNYSYTISKNIYDPEHLRQQNSAEEDLHVTYSFVEYQCPLLVYYDALWLPILELWDNGQFVEFVPVDFVLFEVHGMYNYDYLQSAGSARCVSQPQTWPSMLAKQPQPDPHTAWTRKNYKSCMNPDGPSLTSPWQQYEVLRAASGNRIIFPNYNGFYIFKAIVVDPAYSFCELSTTFSVYVYGAFPKEQIDSGIFLAIFLSIFVGLLLSGFFLLRHTATHKAE
ncbi:cation channel sperm-associated auxiliary subunit delta isoform X1 [Lepisosteus oculatus]|uniref:cation channel sperm-associated auxiliary subunit delta isoform X1 n=2 Tax=Lepisosteus oculatus TaxID=7918 RepID=UPI00371FA2EB